jgi:hypothetical protein
MKTHETIHGWTTPATAYPNAKIGSACLMKYRRGPGRAFFAEGVRGLLTYEYASPVKLTMLRVDGRLWMTDEPQYVWSLESFAERSRGNVLVAGLGLGLVVHYLVRNPSVTKITVVELSEDVIRMVRPLLPKDPRIEIVHHDFYQFVFNKDTEARDTVIWDLGQWSGESRGDDEGRGWIRIVKPVLLAKYGGAVQVFRHGLDRDPVGERFVNRHPDKIAQWRKTLTQVGAS